VVEASGAVSRRAFLAAGSVAAGAALLPARTARALVLPTVCVFSKHLQFLDYAQLAAACKEAGLDGIDLTVRPKGHVLPENVEKDLPRAVEMIRGAGLSVPMITTVYNDAKGDRVREVIATAKSLQIPFLRVGNHQYDMSKGPWEQLPGFVDELRPLVGLAETEMAAGYHNHSGRGNVGAALWDLHWMIREINSPSFGSNFDVGHATVEGAYGAWEINTRLMAPHVKMVAVKDFVWDGDKPKWVPLGQGVVKLVEMYSILREGGFAGPISLHFEYDVPEDRMVEEVRGTALLMRKVLADAGYTGV
jgi:sugar phosphate isomerase/epimerase